MYSDKLKTINCKNCVVKITSVPHLEEKEKLTANVKWTDGVKQVFTNIIHKSSVVCNKFIISHKEQGFYYLNKNKIIYVIDSTTQRTVITSEADKDDEDDEYEHNCFGSFDSDDILYMSMYDKLFLGFFGGDRDYVWIYDLSKYDQKTGEDNNCSYNGVWNNSLYFGKHNERYVLTVYHRKHSKFDYITLIDTKTSTIDENVKEITIRKNLQLDKNTTFNDVQNKFLESLPL